ncbi:histidine kinase [Streptomyces sp. NPDC127100]|uniref:histidine kinase n=1 Tax=Streptomyces sp. NPDC127100 TaxID=3347138 RepID=UPI0036530AF0
MTSVLPCLAAAKTCSVLVSDPDLSVRAVLSAVIGSAPELTLVGEAADADETVARAARTRPDLVLLGAGAVGPDLAAVTGRLLAAADPPRVIVLAVPGQREHCREALAAGASGLLLRDAPAEEVLCAISAVSSGYLLVAPDFAASAIVGNSGTDAPPASPAGSAVTSSRPRRGSVRRMAAADNRLLAQDVHDVLGRTLAAINRKGELAVRLLATRPDRARAELETVLELARRSMTEVRALVDGYRPSDLATEIEGVRCDLEILGTRVEVRRTRAALPRAVQEVFGWVVREAGANVIRHSEAAHCSIEVWTRGRTARLRISNDGVRHPASASGSGLLGLAARLRAEGGTLTHGPVPHAAYRVEASVPISHTDVRREDGDQAGPGRGRGPHQGSPH